ncbi:hypothetical protein PACTADRAFT_50725 [Pachysolen tannophilus NRRL Y-2460]|uniref:Major facilitator superfamily (MFS) profile domain-containing protein n=1 Tax=Pachysolen tannophilus NRRL Y-2460 TaxID=669874 RepID=A0A1E4TSZ3_PACTA|nr:hypothetical protein PACTADRAFT_50725 [Pachysolen tannophilus NRRL Y-2460]
MSSLVSKKNNLGGEVVEAHEQVPLIEDAVLDRETNLSLPSSSPVYSGKINNYTGLNFLGFSVSCFFNIAFIVFLTSSQTYFMTDVLGISEKLGSYVGKLGFYDELLSMALVPFIGALCDKIGSRPIECFGVLIMGLSFIGVAFFVKNSVFPGMLIWRLVFSIGVTSAMSVVTVMLIELNNSNFVVSDLFNFEKNMFNRANTENIESSSSIPSSKGGKQTSLIGIFSGLGAIFAVFFFLRLPISFGRQNDPSDALKKTYYTVGLTAIIISGLLFTILYKDDSKRVSSDNPDSSGNGNYNSSAAASAAAVFNSLERGEEEAFDENAGFLELDKDISYSKTLERGFSIAIQNPTVLMSYLGSFMARLTTITTSVFIPFYVNNYFYQSGKCSTFETDKSRCPESYILSSILTGIAQTVALICGPFVGILIDRSKNQAHLLVMTSGISMLCSLGLSFISKPDESTAIYFYVCMLGFTQISFIIISMTLLSNINSRENYYKSKGSMSGVYTLFGGFGILVMNITGGYIGDWFISGPFVLLFLSNLVFVGGMFLLRGVKEDPERNCTRISNDIKEYGLFRFLFDRQGL